MPDSHDTTEDYPPRAHGPAGSPARDSFLPDQRIVAGGGSEATETRWLLQQRLRAASLVLVVGFGLFFVRSLCCTGTASNRWRVLFHGLLLGLLVLSLALLSSRWKPTLRELRIFEVVLFASIIVFFMAAQYVMMLRGVRDNNPILLPGRRSRAACSGCCR